MRVGQTSRRFTCLPCRASRTKQRQVERHGKKSTGKRKLRSNRTKSRRERERERQRQSKQEFGIGRAVREGAKQVRGATRDVVGGARGLKDAVLGGGRNGRRTSGFTLSADRPGVFSPSSEMARAKLGSRSVEIAIACTLGAVVLAARLLGGGGGGRAGSRGRGTWVKDRSLGGKMVFVPADAEAYDLPSSAATSRTASAISAGSVSSPQPPPSPAEPKRPEWWRYDRFKGTPNAEALPQARHLLMLLEGAKTAYQRDVSLEDLVQLKLLCQQNSLEVSAKTRSSRDSMVRTAVEGCLDAAEEGRTSVGLAADPSTDFLNGLCVALGVPSDRVLTIASGETAARLRALLLQAFVHLRTAEDLELMRTLIAVDNVLTLFPLPGMADAPEAEVVARSLAGRLRGEEAETLMKQYPGDKDENVALVRQLLGLR